MKELPIPTTFESYDRNCISAISGQVSGVIATETLPSSNSSSTGSPSLFGHSSRVEVWKAVLVVIVVQRHEQSETKSSEKTGLKQTHKKIVSF